MSDESGTYTSVSERYAFKFESFHGDTALMISEGNELFWQDYGQLVTIIGWEENPDTNRSGGDS